MSLSTIIINIAVSTIGLYIAYRIGHRRGHRAGFGLAVHLYKNSPEVVALAKCLFHQLHNKEK